MIRAADARSGRALCSTDRPALRPQLLTRFKATAGPRLISGRSVQPGLHAQLNARVSKRTLVLAAAEMCCSCRFSPSPGCLQVVNDALRAGLPKIGKRERATPFHVKPHSFGLKPGIDPDKLNQLLDQLEAEEFSKKMLR